MRFANPIFLLLLLSIPAIVWYYLKRLKPSAISYPSLALITKVFPVHDDRGKVMLFMRLAAITLLILAFARPQKGLVTSESSTKGIDIMLCMDTSSTMRALDFQPKNRIEVAKETAKEL